MKVSVRQEIAKFVLISTKYPVKTVPETILDILKLFVTREHQASLKYAREMIK